MPSKIPSLRARREDAHPKEWPIRMTYEALHAELVKLRDCFALVSQEPERSAARRSGTGGWWELSGYADVLSDAIERIAIHRRRTIGVDKQIEKRSREDAHQEEP